MRAGGSLLTQHVDKGVGQQVAVLVGGVALVHGAGASHHILKPDGVSIHYPAGVVWRVWEIKKKKVT